MKQTFTSWLQQLVSRETPQLVVEGKIVEAGSHQPRTHLGPKQAQPKAYFTIEISRAALTDGTARSVEQIVPAEFTGPIGLLDQFSIGQFVRVRTTTTTGRQIQQIDSLTEDG